VSLSTELGLTTSTIRSGEPTISVATAPVVAPAVKVTWRVFSDSADANVASGSQPMSARSLVSSTPFEKRNPSFSVRISPPRVK